MASCDRACKALHLNTWGSTITKRCCHGMQEGEAVHFLCKCSFLEIYNETITDLLSMSDGGLHIREDIKQGVYVDGLVQAEVANGVHGLMC